MEAWSLNHYGPPESLKLGGLNRNLFSQVLETEVQDQGAVRVGF